MGCVHVVKGVYKSWGCVQVLGMCTSHGGVNKSWRVCTSREGGVQVVGCVQVVKGVYKSWGVYMS